MFVNVRITSSQCLFTVLYKRDGEILARTVNFCKSLRTAKAYAGFCRDEHEVILATKVGMTQIFDENGVRIAHKCVVNGKQKWLAN